MYRFSFQGAALAALLLSIALLPAPVSAELPFESPPIDYLSAPATDRVAQLQQAIDAGQAKLEYDEPHGYLPSVLAQLKVPVSSQVLVFSKTSFQRTHISPKKPRALFFSDDVYVGSVQDGDLLEFSVADPQLGAVFYTLPAARTEKPVFQRQTHDCLICHASSRTEDVPGHLVRSVFPDGSGQPVFSSGTYLTTHASPLRERWGGWYVTGRHGAQRHMGNVTVRTNSRHEDFNRDAGANVVDLTDRFDTKRYLSSHSDIVALMVLEHQGPMHNLITRASFETRLATQYDAEMNAALGRSEDHQSDSSKRRIESAATALVKYLLFSGEAQLTERIEGASTFAKEFAALSPRDDKGRSLRDLDLERRLLKYPCSWLIYSAPFDGLPAAVKHEVYRELVEVVSGRNTEKEFSHLTTDDRQAIHEILLATKPDYAAFATSNKENQ